MVEIQSPISLNGHGTLVRRSSLGVRVLEQETTLDPDTGITLGELGRSQIRMERTLDTALTRIERKLDTALADMKHELDTSMKGMEAKLELTRTDHEARIRAVEKWMWAVGGTAGLAGIGTLLVAFVK